MILVSSCLLGENCKYNGGNNKNQKVIDYLKDKEYISVCPEIMGGLKSPRNPCERLNGKVINTAGEDVTIEFEDGANKVLEVAMKNSVTLAILKKLSPSCGNNQIYDGTFSHKIIDGMGVTAQLLTENGIKVVNEDNL